MTRETAIKISNALTELEAIEAVREDIKNHIDNYVDEVTTYLSMDDYNSILHHLDMLVEKRRKILEEM